MNGNSPLAGNSTGSGSFRLPSGQRVEIRADDQVITRILKQRGLWTRMSASATPGMTMVLADVTHRGVDIFIWIGLHDDSGFSWFAFPGASMKSQDVQDFIHNVLPTCVKQPVTNPAVNGEPSDGNSP